MVNPVYHFLVVNQFAAIGLLHASVHSGDKAGLIFKHAVNGFFHQLLGIFAVGGGHSLEPRFNIGGEMYFHTPRDGSHGCQADRSARAGPTLFAGFIAELPEAAGGARR